MHIIVDNYGVYIELEDGKIKLSHEETVRYISPLKISSINLMKACSISSSVIVLAAEKEIPILFYNHTGKVKAMIWSHQYGSISEYRIKQAYFSKHNNRYIWIGVLLTHKIENQVSNLKWMMNRVSVNNEIFEKAIEKMTSRVPELKENFDIESLRSIEAICSKLYWNAIMKGLEKYVPVEKRVKRGAKDPFNVCLNYCYGILYGMVEASLLMVGADPYMGFFHINRHAKPSLVFDHIEPFRPWVDKMLIELFMSTSLKDNIFEKDEDGKDLLTISTRKLLIDSFFKMMEERSYLNERRIKRKDHIHHLSSLLIDTLKKFEII